MVAALGCGRDGADPAALERVGRSHALSELRPAVAGWAGGGAPEVRVLEDGQRVLLEWPLEPDEREALGADGLFAYERPNVAFSARSQGEHVALLCGGEGLERRGDLFGLDALDALAVGQFTLTEDELFVRLDAAQREASLVFQAALERARRDGPWWRPAVGGVCGRGLPVWTGQVERVAYTRRSGGTLRFTFAAEPLDERGRVTLVVRVDGAEVGRVELGAERGCDYLASAAVPLPGGEDFAGAFELEVEGVPARAAVLDPLLGPRDVGRPGSRPWEDPRPDVELYLLDTFRADNLAAYGGDPAWTPRLDAFLARAVVWENAWANSTWTLPAQASMLTGLYPLQHGAIDHDTALPRAAVTLAERLRARGYRTVAVTDAHFVSRTYGLDQGFELFVERREWDLRETVRVARELIARDDGRPLFLFVQTYRTHQPYRTGADEDRSALRALVQRARARCSAYGGDGSLSAEALAAEYEALYRRGAQGLDAVLGAWLQQREAAGALESTALLLTSDHGEAFWEHAEMGHGGEHWEEKLRVPFVVVAPGVQPARREHGVSLVDVPATLLGLAGEADAVVGGGVDALGLDEDRAIRTYSLVRDEQRFTCLQDGLKLFGGRPLDASEASAPRVAGGFHLAEDPAERQLLPRARTLELAVDRGWQRGLVVRDMQPRMDVQPLELSDETRSELAAIGYGAR